MVKVLSDIIDLLAKLLPLLLPYMPGISWTLIAILVGRVMARSVFTKDAHKWRAPVWFWWWGHKTLALHPIVSGLFVGLLWPQEGMTARGSCMYFAGFGAASVVLYEVGKGMLKKRGYDLDKEE